MNFPELVRACPSIAELKAGAVSIAEHEARPWFTYWLADSTIFAMAIDAAAEALDVAPAEIREIALTGLLDAYHTARRRRAKREANAQDAIRGARSPDDQTTSQAQNVAGRARIDGRFYRQLTTGGERQIIPVAVRHQDRPGLKPEQWILR